MSRKRYSTGIQQDANVLSSENNAFGGFRVTTFMIYLSNVESGGHTIFPQAGISVKPKVKKFMNWQFSAILLYPSSLVNRKLKSVESMPHILEAYV